MHTALEASRFVPRARRGFSLVELLVAVSVFLLVVLIVADIGTRSGKQEQRAIHHEQAAFLAEEGIEAVQNIRDADYSSLIDGIHGVAISGGAWTLSGSSDLTGVFSRSVTISTVDAHRKRVDVLVSWNDRISATGTVSLSTYVTDWRRVTPQSGLTVMKTVVNFGGTKTVADFEPYMAGTTTVMIGVPTTLAPGTYAVTEAVDPNYEQTFSGDCDASGLVTLVSGDAKMCTITNTEIVAPAGMLVYANGGSISDLISFKQFQPSGSWSAEQNTADISSTTTNRVARVLRVYASQTRDERIVLSRHYDGSRQFVYAQVFHGGTQTWGDVLLLSSWVSSTYLDVQNFDGAYLNNGNFMVVYTDNTSVPKSAVWNGSSWSAAGSLTSLGSGQIPVWIVLRNRSGSNEAMAAFYTQSSNTITQYYSGSSWSAITTHSTTVSDPNARMVDFDWSRNSPTKGVLVYLGAGNTKRMTYRLWTADGSGSGSWATAVLGSPFAKNVARLFLADRPNANEYQACSQSTISTPQVDCDRVTFSGTLITASRSTNPVLGITDAGTQLSADLAYESAGGLIAFAAYSDATAIPQYKKYSVSGDIFDSTPTPMSTLSNPLKTVRVVAHPTGDDMMVLFGDSSNYLYTIMWNGSTDAMYATPAGKALTTQAMNGSSLIGQWYDFTWQ